MINNIQTVKKLLERPNLKDKIYTILKKSSTFREIKAGDKINERRRPEKPGIIWNNREKGVGK